MAYSDRYRNLKSEDENKSLVFSLFEGDPNELIKEYGCVRLNGFVHLAYNNNVKLIICDEATVLMSPDIAYDPTLYGTAEIEKILPVRMAEITDRWLADKLSAMADERITFSYDSEHDLYYNLNERESPRF